MTVVRSLTTNLDFNVDFQTLNTFNGLLSRFNLKFALGGYAASQFAGQVVAAINNVTDLILDIQDLSNTTGIAFDQLYGLVKAAEDFRIDPRQFETALTRLSAGIQDARRGFGSLFELMRDRPDIQIFNDDGSLRNTLEVLRSIVTSINTIEDTGLRIRAFEDILGGNGARLEEFFRDGFDLAVATAEAYREAGRALEGQSGFARQYRKDLQQISNSFNEVIQNFVIKFSPVILKFSEAIVELTNLYNQYSKAFDKAVQVSADATEGALSIYGRSLLPEMDYGDVWSPVGNGNAAVNVENVFQVSLPAGTPEEQGRALYEATTSSLQGWFENRVLEVMNNNPEVE